MGFNGGVAALPRDSQSLRLRRGTIRRNNDRRM
jgi:hypothetical protein